MKSEAERTIVFLTNECREWLEMALQKGEIDERKLVRFARSDRATASFKADVKSMLLKRVEDPNKR